MRRPYSEAASGSPRTAAPSLAARKATCDGHFTITKLLTVAAIAISIAHSGLAAAQQGQSESHSQIQLASRTFEFGVDVRQMRRDPHFIPITRVPWIAKLVSSDSDLFGTVIHIESYSHLHTMPTWTPNESREKFASARELAKAWALEGFDVRWRTKTAPSTRGDLYLFPEMPATPYYVICAYDRIDRIPRFCSAHALYPPDPGLRINIRIYRVTDPLNDFEVIVEQALNLVYCLDVTREIDGDTERATKPSPSVDLSTFLRDCKSLIS